MEIIKNRAELELTKVRSKALDLVEHGIWSVLPSTIMDSAVQFRREERELCLAGLKYDLNRKRLFVIGGGKASGLMAQTLESIVAPENIEAGVVNCKDSNYITQKIRIVEAGHPVPDERGVHGVEDMLALRKKFSVDKNDLIVCLISGGGSALLPCPSHGISLGEKQEVTRLLMSSGADIHEINTVRKHLSKTKGGGLGQYFAPATVVSLILSDVVGDNLDVIASGPTVPDPSTFEQAWLVLEKYGLVNRVAESVRLRLKSARSANIPENPGELGNCRNFLIGNNRIALAAMKKKAEDLGLKALVITSEQTGEPSKVAMERVKEIIDNRYSGYNALFIGGETTPKLPPNPGRGGRNQHFVAQVLECMENYPKPWLCASIGTDGSDFLPDVAGAIADNSTLSRSIDLGVDLKSYLNRYDSNSFFKLVGNSLIQTGNTGTNVCDLMLFLLG